MNEQPAKPRRASDPKPSAKPSAKPNAKPNPKSGGGASDAPIKKIAKQALSARQVAHEALIWIAEQGAYSHIALGALLERHPLEERDRGLCTELVYGTLTWQRVIDEALLARVVSRPLDQVDLPVLVALRVAAYQLGWLDRVPAHAALNEAVEDIKRRGGQGAAGFVNGALRALQRRMEGADLRAARLAHTRAPVAKLALTWSLPDWLAKRLIATFGEAEAHAWGEAFARRPPLWARVVETGEVVRLEGLAEAREAMERGDLAIQDLGSQLVGRMAGEVAGLRVLDACAGLGGKTTQLARYVGESGRVVAVDPQRAKLELLREAAARQGVSARVEVVCGELEQVAGALGQFDVVLVDAPCSGLGVLARHPETRWRRQEADIKALVAVQRGLLEQAAALVKPSGALVYSVCTWTAEEGPGQLAAFLAAHPGWRVEPPAGWAQPVELVDGALRTSPPRDDCDAFWAVRLVRPSIEPSEVER